MNMKKGQAAMEYLMTYGWAILIVIVVVAALYAMGVFRIGVAPIGCSPCFSGFALVGYTKTGPTPSTGGSLKITTSAEEINITSLTATLPDGSSGTADLVGGIPQLITPSTTIEIRNITNTTATVELAMTYIVTATGYSYSKTATIHN